MKALTSTSSVRFQRLSAVILSVLLAASLSASELPVRSFTTVDGLSDNRLHRIILDSRGLLWICSVNGISRFDGSHFQVFGVAQGLPFPSINDLLETPDGDFWLATNGGGVIRFPISSRPLGYETFSVSSEPTSNRVNRLHRGPDGTMWAGTDGGLFRMTVGTDGKPVFVPVSLRLRSHPDATVQIWSMTWDAEGSAWVGTRFGLVRILPGGRVISYAVRTDLETDHVFSVLYTPSDGLLWIAHQSELAVFKPPPASSYEAEQGLEHAWESQSIARSGLRRPGNILDEHIALPQAPGDAVQLSISQPGVLTRVTDLLQSRSGAIRVISSDAIFDFSAGRFTLVSDARFRGALMGAAVEDQDGNLWVAGQTGLLRVARRGFTTFREPDGLGRTVGRVFVSRAGELIAISEGWRVSRFNGESFHTVRANVPESARRFGPTDQSVVEDRAGDWWFATGVGLVRFSRVKRIEDLATMAPRLYTSRDGLAQDDIRSVFEDASGGIWIAGLIPGREVLTRWDRASGQFRRYSDADGLPAFNSPTSFYEDPRGVLWIGFRDGGIARHEAGHFRMLTESNGLPRGGIGAAIADHTGRLWCANALVGLYRIDDLDAEHLRPVFVVTPKELRGALIARSVEDAFGSIYVATPQGVMRIDDTSASGPPSARIAGVYGTNDGLASNEVLGASSDRQGRLWLSTRQGLSYYQPKQPARPPAPQVRLGGLRVAGVEHPVSPAGEQSLSNLDLIPGHAQLEIEFFGISFAAGESLTFEYRLRGADEGWSAPSPSRSVLFSNLAPGGYEFEVRSVSAGGERSAQTARATFRVLPPIWRRWWFVTLAAVVLVSGLAAFERYRAAHARDIARAREERLVELEQVRTRIAADLHDEIGSSLTQISILSEVACRQGAEGLPELSRPLATIAASSRELVDSMSDIVWAINPAKDYLADLTQRMRRLASDAFTAGNMAFTLDLPPSEREIKLGASVRREVFLIFKEAVTNIIKHAACSEVSVRLAIEGGVLRLELHDNGQGFDPLTPTDGHGLASLRNRAAALGGTLAVVSTPGAGTAITLDLPITT